ncbi:hypothetical protein [Kitasatospora purpeofusca]|uniref:Uncharacterized protein n=1 Tax=Kitasatospora purpeofusca TaxID=67352 RepID=A0ABZ1UBI0_9ACTN|nr:hypothetical protein [Kitasatospora purpeofusca]
MPEAELPRLGREMPATGIGAPAISIHGYLAGPLGAHHHRVTARGRGFASHSVSG